MADDILSDLDFEQKIAELDDRGLIEFVARQQHDMARRMRKVEGRSKRAMGTSSGIGALAGAMVVGAIDYVLRRGG